MLKKIEFFKRTLIRVTVLLTWFFPFYLGATDFSLFPELILRYDAMDVNGDGETDNYSDGTDFSSWRTSNGNDSVDAFQLEEENRPELDADGINRFPSVYFGTDKFFNVPNDTDINLAASMTEKSFSLVFKSGSDVDGTRAIYEQGADAKGFTIVIHESEIWFGATNIFTWAEQNRYRGLSLGEVKPDTVYLLTVVYDASNSDITKNSLTAYKNGTLVGTLDRIEEQTGHSGAVGLGFNNGGMINPVTERFSTASLSSEAFHLGEFILWNHALSKSEVLLVRESLSEKWDLTLFTKITPVPKNVNMTDIRPSWIFTSSKTGTLAYAGDCHSSKNTVEKGESRIDFTDSAGNDLADGTYSNCVVNFEDEDGVKVSLKVNTFTVERDLVFVSDAGDITGTITDVTPTISFTPSLSGEAEIVGSCEAESVSVTAGVATEIEMKSLADGRYSDCFLEIEGHASLPIGRADVSGFTVDTTAPLFSITESVTTPAYNLTPSFSLNSIEKFELEDQNGNCPLQTTGFFEQGNREIFFSTLAEGTYDCSFTIRDEFGNGVTLDLPTFQILRAGINLSADEINLVENGNAVNFTAALNDQPTGEVTLSVSASAGAAFSVAPASVSLNAQNWSQVNTFTLTPTNNSLTDGLREGLVSLSTSGSDASEYAELLASEVSVAVADDDSPGFELSLPDTLAANEGDSLTFSLRLNSQPDENSTVSVVALASDGDEVIFSTSENDTETAVFNDSNWNSPQSFTLKLLTDRVQDGDKSFSVLFSLESGSQQDYIDAGPPDSFDFTAKDIDVAGITFSDHENLSVGENGSTAQFSIRLNTIPTANVTVAASTAGTDEISLSEDLVFTSQNWNASQSFNVAGVDDDFFDGDQPVQISFTVSGSDSNYANLSLPSVAVVNRDDDTAGFSLKTLDGGDFSGNLNVAENGDGESFAISLDTEPLSSVEVSLSVSDATEATVSPTSIVFDGNNWNSLNRVDVSGLDDDIDDETQTFQVRLELTESGSDYQGIVPPFIDGFNADNDTAGYELRTVDSETGENGDEAELQIRLNASPLDDFSLEASLGNTDEAVFVSGLNERTLTFTPENWSAFQTIRIRGVNDFEADGNQDYEVSFSLTGGTAEGTYDEAELPASVVLSNVDDDQPGFSDSFTAPLTVSESGGTAVIEISLTSKPFGDVALSATLSDGSEATVSPNPLIIAPDRWDAANRVTVSGVDDMAQDGNQPVTLVFSVDSTETADQAYVALGTQGLESQYNIVNTDDDSAGFSITGPLGETLGALDVAEDGSESSFSVSLVSEPLSETTVRLSVDDASEVAISPSTLTFNADNWQSLREVRLTGLDDDLVDGNQKFGISISSSSESTDYSGLSAETIEAVNADLDSAGYVFEEEEGLVVNESGSSDSFGIHLTAKPASAVTILASLSKDDEATIQPSSLTFNPEEWNSVKSFVIQGKDDFLDDGNQPVNIIFSLASDSSKEFLAVDPPQTLRFESQDNDSAGYSIKNSDGQLVSGDHTVSLAENKGNGNFLISLTSQPVSDFDLDISLDNDSQASLLTTRLSFTQDNWNSDQRVGIVGLNDDVADGNVPVGVVLTPRNPPQEYDSESVTLPSVGLVVRDDDEAGFSVSGAEGFVSEFGNQFFFNLNIHTEPSATVTVTPAAADETEANVSPASYTFNASNWQTPARFTVSGIDDSMEDGDIAFSVVTSYVSDSSEYDGEQVLPPAKIDLVNLDRETPGILLEREVFEVNEGGSNAFRMKLRRSPAGEIELSVQTAEAEYKNLIPNKKVHFDPTNWNQFQSFEIALEDDEITNGHREFNLLVYVSKAGEGGDYASLPPQNLRVALIDNDVSEPPLPSIVYPASNSEFTKEEFMNLNFAISTSSTDVTNYSYSLIRCLDEDLTVGCTQKEMLREGVFASGFTGAGAALILFFLWFFRSARKRFKVLSRISVYFFAIAILGFACETPKEVADQVEAQDVKFSVPNPFSGESVESKVYYFAVVADNSGNKITSEVVKVSIEG